MGKGFTPLQLRVKLQLSYLCQEQRENNVIYLILFLLKCQPWSLYSVAKLPSHFYFIKMLAEILHLMEKKRERFHISSWSIIPFFKYSIREVATFNNDRTNHLKNMYESPSPRSSKQHLNILIFALQSLYCWFVEAQISFLSVYLSSLSEDIL